MTVAPDAAAAGFDRARLDQASAPLKMAIEAGDLAGGVTLVWREGRLADVTVTGLADIAERRPMTRDTLFRVASMTKPVTSVAALMLLEEGVWSLQDPISRWAPEFAAMRVLRRPDGPLDDTAPAARPITLEDLFAHRSGLAYGFTSVGPIAHAHQSALGDPLTADMPVDDWMQALAGLPLTFQPGERFHYGLSTDVLGVLVGRASGLGFREFLFERVFRPLGMADTDFYIPPAKRGRAATLYRGEAGKPLEPIAFPARDTAPQFCGGGGGLISTADDYLPFARALLNGGEADGVRLLKPETVAMMRANRLTDAQRTHDFLGMPFWSSQGFGLGVLDDPRSPAARLDGGGARGRLRLAGRLRHLVAGRSGRGYGADLPDPGLSAARPRGGRQHGPSQPAPGRAPGPAAVAEAGLRGARLSRSGRSRAAARTHEDQPARERRLAGQADEHGKAGG